MKLEIEIDPAAIADGIDKSIRGSLTKAADESIKYGSLGRELKSAADKALAAAALAVLADESFQALMRSAIQEGLLTGIRSRAEKIARGMPVQQAMDLAGVRGALGKDED